MKNTHHWISVDVFVQAPLEKVWGYWTEPEHIKEWNAASPDWHTSEVVNHLRVGGHFTYHMEARDKSEGFDFSGVYTEIVLETAIAYTLKDGRRVRIVFEQKDDGVKITETFQTEELNPGESQQNGWQAILNSFKRYVELGS